jgi:hypothetical protein
MQSKCNVIRATIVWFAANAISARSSLLTRTLARHIYTSIVRHKAVPPNDFASLTEMETTLPGFPQRYEESAVRLTSAMTLMLAPSGIRDSSSSTRRESGFQVLTSSKV